MIQHKEIPDSQRHEPKGASTAGIGTVYCADGSGSGVWKKIGYDNVEGLYAYGSMTITGNTTAFPMTAVADTSFNTPSQFSLLTGTGAPLTGESLKNITFNVDRLQVKISGVYEIKTYCNIASFPSNSSRVSLRYLINGLTYSVRGPIVKCAVAGDSDIISSHGLVTLSAGDYLQNVVATDTTGGLVIRDYNTSLILIERL